VVGTATAALTARWASPAPTVNRADARNAFSPGDVGFEQQRLVDRFPIERQREHGRDGCDGDVAGGVADHLAGMRRHLTG